MTAREFLNRGWQIDGEIKSKEAQIQKLRDQATHVGAFLSGDKVQTSIKTDCLSDTVARIADLEAVYREDVKRLVDVKKEILVAINTVGRSKYRLVLTERYVNYKRWEDIAADNNLSWRSVHRIHSAALREILLSV